MMLHAKEDYQINKWFDHDSEDSNSSYGSFGDEDQDDCDDLPDNFSEADSNDLDRKQRALLRLQTRDSEAMKNGTPKKRRIQVMHSQESENIAKSPMKVKEEQPLRTQVTVKRNRDEILQRLREFEKQERVTMQTLININEDD